MRFFSLGLAAVALGASAASAQSTTDAATLSINTAAAATVSRPTVGFNSASTARIISTDTEAPSSAVASAASSSTPAASVPYYNVSALPSTVSDAPRTASSNFTLPKPDATAAWNPALVVQSSNPYVMQVVDTADMPTINWNLLNHTQQQRQIICDQQTSFCQTAGCKEAGATIKDNFCNVDTMATKCSCTKGDANLQQYNWPVQFADCTGRSTTCTDDCMKPGGTTAERTACRDSCHQNFASTCGLPGQYAANYAVDKESQKPKLGMIQGGTAADSVSRVAVSSALVGTLAVAAVIALSA